MIKGGRVSERFSIGKVLKFGMLCIVFVKFVMDVRDNFLRFIRIVCSEVFLIF